jgi:hypothetical protein
MPPRATLLEDVERCSPRARRIVALTALSLFDLDPSAV